jgi:glyoxylase-like metal-dependent hydrolase (beta-lactamase superfamily II)
VARQYQSTQPQEVAAGVFFIEGPASNWVILRREMDFTVIDGGYPGDIPLVVETIRTLGLDPSRAAAMLITHGHIDHTGAAQYFSEEFGTPILSSAGEHGALLGTEKFQVAPKEIILQAWRPRVFRWMLHVLAAEGLKTNNIKAASVFDAAALADLPGSPVAVPTAGHTPGHTSFHLPAVGVVVTGDALASGHAFSHELGPQMLPPMFHHDPEAAYRALPALAALAATTILPGHGPALRSDIAAAVAAVPSLNR